MPVKKVGKNKYQWGNEKIYEGKGAKEKAIKQGIAIKISEEKTNKRKGKGRKANY